MLIAKVVDGGVRLVLITGPASPDGLNSLTVHNATAVSRYEACEAARNAATSPLNAAEMNRCAASVGVPIAKPTVAPGSSSSEVPVALSGVSGVGGVAGVGVSLVGVAVVVVVVGGGVVVVLLVVVAVCVTGSVPGCGAVIGDAAVV